MNHLRRIFQIPLARALAPIVLLLATIPFLSQSPQFVERFYTRGLYARLTAVLSSFSAITAVSISELSLYVAVAGFIGIVAVALVRRQWEKAFVVVLGSVGAAAVWFYLVWGCNYFRMPIDAQLGIDDHALQPDSVSLRQALEWNIAETNRFWQAVPQWDLAELDEKIETGYRKLNAELNLPEMPGRRRPKLLVVPALFNYTLTSGMFGPFFHEIHLNSGLLSIELPFVLAHEKAHQMGFATESEANFLAALVCLESDDPAVRYSGYFALSQKFIPHAVEFNDADTLLHSVRKEVWADFKAVRERYEKYMGTISSLSEKSYDLYLRANQVEGGVANYGKVVELMIRWRLRKAVQSAD